MGVAVRCPACDRVSVNLVSHEHVDLPFHNDGEIGVVEHVFARGRAAHGRGVPGRALLGELRRPQNAALALRVRTVSKKVSTDTRRLHAGRRGGSGAPDLDRHPDQPGDDRRLLGSPGHPRRRRPDDGALAALRRLDEVGRAPHLGPGVPDRLPAGARRRRLGAARRAAVGELVPGAHHRLVGEPLDRRPRRRPAHLPRRARVRPRPRLRLHVRHGRPQPAAPGARRLQGAGARGAGRDVSRALRGAGTRATSGRAGRAPPRLRDSPTQRRAIQTAR